MKKLSIALGLLLLCGIAFGADLAGVWTGKIVFKTPVAGGLSRDVTMTLKTSGPHLTGTVSGSWDGHHDSATILDGKFNGNEIYFTIATGAADIPRMEFAGKLEGDELKITISGKNVNDGQEWKFADTSLKRGK